MIKKKFKMGNSGSISNSKTLLLLLLTSSFFFTALLFDYMPMIVDNQIKRTVELATNDDIRSIWSKPPVDLHSYYWLYEALNAEQFMAGEKIRVRKVGPFHFTSRIEKRIIELSTNKYRIVYNTSRLFSLDESTPSDVIKLDENITVLNPIYASLMEATREMVGKMDNQTANMMTVSSNRLAERFNETLFLNITARASLLGRKVQLIEKARKMITTFGIDADLPSIREDNVFGFVALLNGTLSGPFEIYTGYQISMPSLGDLISYQGKRRGTEYKGKCNRIQASVGELRPMPLQDEQMLEMYLPNLCRIIRLRPTGLKKLREGLAISYIHAHEDFLSADMNPDKKCFCVNGTTDNYCSLSGAIELAPCAYHSPIVLTTSTIQPDARLTDSIADYDPELLVSDVENLPAPSKTAQLLILKRLGVPVKADLTYTLFLKVRRDARFRGVATIPEVSYIPVLMMRETAVIPPPLGQIVVNLENFLTLTYHMKVIMYLSTVVLLCWLTGHYYGNSTRDRVMPSSTNGTSSADGAAGIRSNLNTGNDSSSERVNSADSSRSQPPTRRNSRTNSLIEAMSNASGDNGNNNNNSKPATTETSRYPKQQGTKTSDGSATVASIGSTTLVEPKAAPPITASGGGSLTMLEGKELSFSAVSALDRAKQNPATSTNLTRENENRPKRSIARSSRIFSKVDEEWNDEGQINEQQADCENEKKFGPAGDLTSNERLTSSDDNLLTTNSDGAQPAPSRSEQQDLTEQPVKLKSDSNNKRHKGWFMQVCSNFVRLLTGIRGSLSEASQLNVVENDFRDKQLEMLAGKIDNWYNSNTSTTDSASPTGALVISQSTETATISGGDQSSGSSGTSGNSGSTTKLSPIRETADLDRAEQNQMEAGEAKEPNKGELMADDGQKIVENNESVRDDEMKVEGLPNNSQLREEHEALPDSMTSKKDTIIDRESKIVDIKLTNENSLGSKPEPREGALVKTELEDASKDISSTVADKGLGEDFSREEVAQTSEREQKEEEEEKAKGNEVENGTVGDGFSGKQMEEKEKGKKEQEKKSEQNDLTQVTKIINSENVDALVSKEKSTNTNRNGNDNKLNDMSNGDAFPDALGQRDDNDDGSNDISNGTHINRKDSEQSNQTIINNGHTTSGDESVTSEDISSNDNQDKATAFERIEVELVA